MCFFLPPKKKPGCGRGRRGGSSTSSKHHRSYPPSLEAQKCWDDTKEELVREDNTRAYQKVFSHVDRVEDLKKKLAPPPGPPPKPLPTLEDIQKLLAQSNQERDNKEKERERDKRQEAQDRRIARLEQERYSKENERRVSKTVVLPDVVLEWMEGQRAESERLKMERELDAAVDRKLLDMQRQGNGISWGNNNNNGYGNCNGGYGNNGFPAPPAQGLLGSSVHNGEECERRWKKIEKRQDDLEYDNDILKRYTRRCLQGGGPPMFSSWP